MLPEGLKCPLAHIQRIFFTRIRLLAIELKKMFPWPSKELIAKHTPAAFKQYLNTRIIIDCTEFYVQRPSSLQVPALTFSHYKHHNTFKLLLDISPGDVITFISELWGKRVFDKTITEKLGLLDLLKPDLTLANCYKRRVSP